jgi:hypothetical protein
MPLLAQLAQLYPSSKFVSIISDHCIENYPDKNCPTMLVYRKGQMMGQIVGMGSMGGDKAKLVGTLLSKSEDLEGAKLTFVAGRSDVERILFAFRGIDFHLKVDTTSSSQFSSRSNAAVPLRKNAGGTSSKDDGSADEDSEDDQTFVGGGRKTGIRNSRKDDSDDEYDL